MNATVDKAEIENAIEEINGVIMDFTDAVDSLTGVKNLLYKLIENNTEKKNDRTCHTGCPYRWLGLDLKYYCTSYIDYCSLDNKEQDK